MSAVLVAFTSSHGPEHGAATHMVVKCLLCALALERMDLGCAPSEALLIDNRTDNLLAWEAQGGAGYHFTTDDEFRIASAAGIDALVRTP